MKMKHTFIMAICAITLALACKKEHSQDVRDFGKVTIDSISPPKSSSDAYIKVYGKNFPYQKSEIRVTLNNTALTVTEVTKDAIRLYIPAGATSGEMRFEFDRTDPNTGYDYSDLLDNVITIPYIIDESLKLPPLLAVYFSLEGNKLMKGTFSNNAAPVVTTLYDNSADGEDGISGISTPANNSSQDDFIYWGYQGVNSGLMRREYFIKKGATDKSQPLSSVYPPSGLGNYVRDMDVRGSTVYFIRVGGPNPNSNYIVSTGITGGALTELYELQNDPEVWGLKGSADNTNTGIWWVEHKTKQVMRGSSTGAAAVTLFDENDGLISPNNIALDEAHGKIYVLDVDANYKPRILVGNLDGSGSLTVLPIPVASFGSYLYDIEIDTKNGYLYWITQSTDASFMRCNTDGTNVQTILEHLNEPGGWFDILLP
jgi:hypothetical protein